MPREPQQHLGLRKSPAQSLAHSGCPVSSCWVLLMLVCSFFPFILPHPTLPAISPLYGPFHERMFERAQAESYNKQCLV